MSKRGYLEYLPEVGQKDLEALYKAEKNYGDSWKKRGGVGAFMMASRKWDRLENFLSKQKEQYDIFTAIEQDQRPEGIIDDIRDLRRYLLLIEAEMVARNKVPAEVKKDEPYMGETIKSQLTPKVPELIITNLQKKEEFVSHGYKPELDE